MDPLQDSQYALPDNNNDSSGIPSPQFALLNYFFPGYSVLISTLNTSLGADFNRYLPFVVVAIAVVFSWRYVYETVMGLVEANFMSSFTVHTDDETYNILMWWMTRQPFSHRTRNFVVNTSVYSRNDNLYRSHDDSEDEDEDEDAVEGVQAASSTNSAAAGEDNAAPTSSSRGKHVLHYTPSAGTHWFWYRGVPLRFARHQTKDKISLRNPSEQEELCVSCLGRDPAVLKRLLADARALYLRKDDRKTVIYRATSSVSSYGTDSYWQRCMSRPNRDFSTVILPDAVKKDIIADVGDYLEPATRRWYANRGIPYRRGYLLHGPPGTGKSSLSVALAGLFRMKIYIVSLSSLTATEENLASLFAELPTNCIVLLEDIDTAGLSKTREKKKDGDDKEESDSAPARGQLSLSALLNILDGVAAQEGRVLIMTTNHLENLDKALIRPGRVDMIIPFQLADADMSESIFRAIYTPFDGELGEGCLTKGKGKEALIDEVAVLAKEFGRRIPAGEFSPAEIQGLLLRHKRSSQEAVNAVEAWVVQMRADKKDKAERDQKEKEEKEEKERKEKEKKEKEEKEEKDKKSNKGKKKEKKKAKKAEDDTGDEEDSDDDNAKDDADNNSETDDEDKTDEKDKKEQKKKKNKSRGSSDSGYATP